MSLRAAVDEQMPQMAVGMREAALGLFETSHNALLGVQAILAREGLGLAAAKEMILVEVEKALYDEQQEQEEGTAPAARAPQPVQRVQPAQSHHVTPSRLAPRPFIGKGMAKGAMAGAKGGKGGRAEGICDFFVRFGNCTHGDRCHFQHPQEARRYLPYNDTRGKGGGHPPSEYETLDAIDSSC